LRWEDVDLERGLLALPDSKTGKKAIVLNAPAMTVLPDLPHLGAYVIAGQDAGTEKEKPRADLNKPWRSVAKRAGLVGLEMHGGKIWVESQLGQGSTFAFKLQVIVERQAEPAT
jgi:hypothetical protein